MIAKNTALFLDVATELLSRGNRVRFRAEGGSMYPTIRGGDAIVVEPVQPLELRSNDIFLYWNHQRAFVHRLAGIANAGNATPTFAFRGEAADASVENVPTHQVLGRVTAVERKVRIAGLLQSARVRFGRLMGSTAFNVKTHSDEVASGSLLHQIKFNSLMVAVTASLALVAIPVAPAMAANCIAAGTGNWSAITWTNCAAGPTASDTVLIAGNFTVTVNVTNAVANSLQIGSNSANQTGALAFAATGNPALTVSGAVVVGGNGNNTQRAGSITFQSGSTLTAASVTVGAVGAGNNSPGTITMTLGGTLNTGSFAFGTDGAGDANFTAGAGTVVMTNNNTLPGAPFNSFNNLTVSVGTTTLGAATTIGGTLQISGGATLNTSASNFGVTLGGDFTNAGTFTANASPITIAGTATQSIAGFVTTGLVSMTKTGGTATFASVVNGGAFTLNGTGGTLDLGSSQTHVFTGILTRTAGTVTGTSSTINLTTGVANTGTGGTFSTGTTVNYSLAGAQTVAGGTYQNLTISGSGTKSLGAAITTNGTLAITAGTLDTTATNFSVTLNGDFTNAGTFNGRSSPIAINGTVHQSIAGFTTGGAVTVAKTAGTYAQIQGDVTALTLTVSSGLFDQGCSRALTVGRLILSGGNYINCRNDNGGTAAGTLTFASNGLANLAVTNAASRFDYIGAGAITFNAGKAANVTNVAGGTIRINGGTNACGDADVQINSGVSNTWTTTAGNFYLADVDLQNQVASAALTIYSSTLNRGTNTGWTNSTNCNGSRTLVTLESLSATPIDGGILISLQTSRDVNNLGFNLYREENGQRVKLNKSLLAGSALMGGAGTSFSAGQSRRWRDSEGEIGALYWLEEVDLSGVKTWYGPAVAGGAAFGGKAKAGAGGVRLAQVGHSPTANAVARYEEVATAMTLSSVGSLARATGGHNTVASPKAITATKAAPSPQSLQKQYGLAAGAAVRLEVNTEGWYRATQSQLVAAGISADVDPRTLQLYLNGVQQPIYVQAAVKSKFGPQDAIYFYGMGADTTWSGSQTYWLVAGPGNGLRMNVSGASRGTANSTNFPSTVAWKPRTLYFAALLNQDNDNFFGPTVTDTGVSQALPANSLNSSGGGSSLQVKLQGVTENVHSVAVSLNGANLGNVTFVGKGSTNASFNVPALNPGANNTLTLTSSGAGDVSVVDEVRLSYPRAFVAEGDTLRFTAQAGSLVTVGGFSTPPSHVIDVTNPASPSLILGQVSGSAPNYSLTIAPATASGTRTLLAVGASQVQTPTITANLPSTWNAAQAGYDMVIIGHKSLLPSAAPLASLRQTQGMKVATVDVEDLYDEFSFGVKSPYAIKDFMANAKANWTTKPRFVLLLGNGTFDPRNYLGTSVPDLVPVKLVDTSLLETASDDWFVDFDEDGLPDMAIGRLPAESAAEATLMVNRTVVYDQSSTDLWATQALLVSGQPQNPTDDFLGMSASVQAALPPAIVATNLVQATDPAPQANLVAGINAGKALLNFAGHGSSEVWAGGLLDSATALTLNNGAKAPVVLSMTCLNGYFQDVYTTSIAKAFMKAQGGGAIAVWASSGLTEPDPQSQMNQEMVKALYSSPTTTIGQAAAAAKAATSNIDVRRTWNLLGDPSTIIQ